MLTVHPLTAVIGAEIRGVDLARIDGEQVDGIRRALAQHQVVFFRDQDLTPAQHVALAARFGEIHVSPVTTRHGDLPGIMVLDQTSPKGDGADLWHADETFLPEPPMGTILRALQLPRLGGDTCFASMVAAWESLSSNMQRYLDGLTAEHDIALPVGRAIARGHVVADLDALRRQFPPVRHPVVRTLAETGRKALFVNRNSTARLVGPGPAEGEAVLGFLFAHVRSPDLQCRFRWQAGSMAFFDNRSAQHYAVADYRERRVMHRVTLRGDRPR
jgi:taurine dioxygenase